MSIDIKLSRTQIFKTIQFGEFLGSLLSKLAGPLMKVAVPLAKNILTPLEIIAAASAISGGTTSTISKKETNDIIKIVPNLENPNILPEGVTKAVRNEIR